MLVLLLKGHHLCVVVRLILVLALRLGLTHGFDGFLETVLGLLEVILGLVTLLLQKVKFTFPKSLVFVVGVEEILVGALVVNVFLAEALKLSMSKVAVAFSLIVELHDFSAELVNLILILDRLSFTLSLEMLEFHVNSLVLTSSVLSLLVESSFKILKLLALVIKLSLDVLLLSKKSIGLLLGVPEEFFLVSLEAGFRSLLALF